jgi:imidazole glycerol-phosphate synthase subunit HisH
MIRKCGGVPDVISSPEELNSRSKIVLAGVGSFDAGVKALQKDDWVEILTRLARENGAPILGICLGMQLMCRSSEEGELPGLGWFDAEVKLIKFHEQTNLKVPHMGWNTIGIKKPSVLFDAEEEQRFYFVHSYHVVCNNPSDVIATSHHGYEITAAFGNANIYGVQFHPEKSHRFGMDLIKRFLELQC